VLQGAVAPPPPGLWNCGSHLANAGRRHAIMAALSRAVGHPEHPPGSGRAPDNESPTAGASGDAGHPLQPATKRARPLSLAQRQLRLHQGPAHSLLKSWPARSAIGNAASPGWPVCSPRRQFSGSAQHRGRLKATEAEVIGIEAPVPGGRRGPWGKAKAHGSPGACRRLDRGPPGYPSPASGRLLSKASPAASFMAAAQAGVAPTPSTRISSVWAAAGQKDDDRSLRQWSPTARTEVPFEVGGWPGRGSGRGGGPGCAPVSDPPAGAHQAGAAVAAIASARSLKARPAGPSPRRSAGQGFDAPPMAAGGRFPATTPPQRRVLHPGNAHGAGQHLLVTHPGSSRLVTNLFRRPEPWQGSLELLTVPVVDHPALRQVLSHGTGTDWPAFFPPFCIFRPSGSRAFAPMAHADIGGLTPLAQETPRFQERAGRRYPQARARFDETTGQALCGTMGFAPSDRRWPLQPMPVDF